MRADVSLWDELTKYNQEADGLIARAMKAVEPSPPISREIPVFVSVEALFSNMPAFLATVPAVASDVFYGSNIKKAIFSNNGSRIYIRELGFAQYAGIVDAVTGVITRFESSFAGGAAAPLNFRWNFETSITQKKYSDRRVTARSGGSVQAGTVLTFSDPLVIEPRETFIFECELLNYMGNYASATDLIIAMLLSGYREGM